MKTKPVFFLLAGTLILLGCQSGGPTSPTGQAGSGSTTSNVAAQTTSGGAGGTTTGAKQEEVKTPPPVLPDDLKTEGYHWYGLANMEPVKFTLSQEGGVTYEGTQTVHLLSVKDDKAVFKVERTGGLDEQLGTDTVTEDKTGIFITGSTKFTSPSPNLDMPAKLPPGATWKNKSSLVMTTGQHFDQDMTFKVIGVQNVTTKLGAHSALLVKAEGNLKIDGKPYRMESSQWYVKDKGMVKSMISMTAQDKPKSKPLVITIQETK